jgi:xanthine dehydrogenase YagS FAD-binding subunit
VIVTTDGGVIRDVALGGVGTKHWRAQEAEQALIGKPASQATFETAAKIAFANAKPQTHNAFKIPLGQQAIVRSLTTVTA